MLNGLAVAVGKADSDTGTRHAIGAQYGQRLDKLSMDWRMRKIDVALNCFDSLAVAIDNGGNKFVVTIENFDTAPCANRNRCVCIFLFAVIVQRAYFSAVQLQLHFVLVIMLDNDPDRFDPRIVVSSRE